MEFYNTHILSVVLFTPLVGALLLLFVPARQRKRASRHRQSIRFPGADRFSAAALAVQPWRRTRRVFSSPKNHDWIPLDRSALHAGHRRASACCW